MVALLLFQNISIENLKYVFRATITIMENVSIVNKVLELFYLNPIEQSSCYNLLSIKMS